jgi:hypothetical protein
MPTRRAAFRRVRLARAATTILAQLCQRILLPPTTKEINETLCRYHSMLLVPLHKDWPGPGCARPHATF